MAIVRRRNRHLVPNFWQCAKHEVRTYTRSGSYPLPRALRSTLYSPAVVSWLNHLVVPRLPKVSLSQIRPNYHPLKWQFLSWFQYPQVYFLNTNLVNLTVTLTRGLNANQSNPFQHQSTNKLWTLLSTPSLTNSRGSRVAGPMSRSRVQCRGRGSKVAAAGPKSRSRVQCRGRGSKVAVAGPMSRQGKMIWKRLIWKQYEGKKIFFVHDSLR